jgi:hypothetical protein
LDGKLEYGSRPPDFDNAADFALDIWRGGAIGGLGGFSHERGKGVGEVILATCAGVLNDLIDEIDEVESFRGGGVTQTREPEACYAVCMSSGNKLVRNGARD